MAHTVPCTSSRAFPNKNYSTLESGLSPRNLKRDFTHFYVHSCQLALSHKYQSFSSLTIKLEWVKRSDYSLGQEALGPGTGTESFFFSMKLFKWVSPRSASSGAYLTQRSSASVSLRPPGNKDKKLRSNYFFTRNWISLFYPPFSQACEEYFGENKP